jgi:hypothetical protein
MVVETLLTDLRVRDNRYEHVRYVEHVAKGRLVDSTISAQQAKLNSTSTKYLNNARASLNTSTR